MYQATDEPLTTAGADPQAHRLATFGTGDHQDSELPTERATPKHEGGSIEDQVVMSERSDVELQQIDTTRGFCDDDERHAKPIWKR